MTGGPLLRPLLPIAAGAFLLPLAYALAFAPDIEGFGDDLFFHLTALQLADGHGYVESFDVFSGREPRATAAHPPGYVVALSLVARVGGRSVDAMRIVGVGAGAVTVLVVGLIAGRLAGRRAGIIAALLCAIYPAFIAADTVLMSETMFGALVACSVLLALRLLERPSAAGMAGLGVLVGLAGLTRSEGLMLLPLLAIPLLAPAPGRRLRLAAAFVVTTALVMAPWVVRNTRAFDRPLLSTNEGTSSRARTATRPTTATRWAGSRSPASRRVRPARPPARPTSGAAARPSATSAPTAAGRSWWPARGCCGWAASTTSTRGPSSRGASAASRRRGSSPSTPCCWPASPAPSPCSAVDGAWLSRSCSRRWGSRFSRPSRRTD